MKNIKETILKVKDGAVILVCLLVIFLILIVFLLSYRKDT